MRGKEGGRNVRLPAYHLIQWTACWLSAVFACCFCSLCLWPVAWILSWKLQFIRTAAARRPGDSRQQRCLPASLRNRSRTTRFSVETKRDLWMSLKKETTYWLLMWISGVWIFCRTNIAKFILIRKASFEARIHIRKPGSRILMVTESLHATPAVWSR